VELRYANQLYKVYENAGKRITFLPQGKNWKWMRVQRLFRGNDLNYLSTGCLEHSLRPPSLDYFLPHAVGNHARDFYGVIGDPVEHSFGDVFHRALSLAATDARQHNPSSAKDSAVGNDQRSTSSSFDSGTGHDGIDETGTETYVKIPLKRAEIDNCLHLLPQIGFRGLSVTSPLKSAVFESNFVGTDQDITAGNTLALIRGSFLLFDTDQLGMEAALAEIEADGIAPGTVAIFGSGGARDALTRALEQRGWGPIEIVRARDGWGELTSRGFTLVVDASGSSGSEHTLRHTNAPTCRVWFDLRYRDIPPPPLRAERFYSGMTFYKHQALAQRRLWGLPETNGHPLL
jgi:hypothetical protein